MGIKLRTQHLWISGDIAGTVFGDLDKVYTVYYPQLHALLLAPMDDEIFPTIHKGDLQMLKTRNLEGDKTISLQEIIIDHDLMTLTAIWCLCTSRAFVCCTSLYDNHFHYFRPAA